MATKKAKASNIFSTLRNTFGSENYGIKQFRSDVAKLKKKGLVSKTIDARSQEATRYMRNQVRKFADVLAGRAQVLHVPKSEKQYYQESGFKTKGRNVIVPTPNKEKVRRVKATKEGYPQYTTTQKTPTGTRRGKNTVVPYTDLEGFIRKEVIPLGPLKNGEKYAFRYHGNISYGSFADVELMLNYLARYRSIEEAFSRGDIEAQDGIYRNLEVFKITRSEHQAASVAQQSHYRSERQARNAARRAEWLRARRAAMTPDEREEAAFQRKLNTNHAADAARKRAERANLKESNPAEYQRRIEASKARTKKSRANKK